MVTEFIDEKNKEKPEDKKIITSCSSVEYKTEPRDYLEIVTTTKDGCVVAARLFGNKFSCPRCKREKWNGVSNEFGHKMCCGCEVCGYSSITLIGINNKNSLP